MTSFSWPQEWVPNIECVNTWVFMISQPGILPKCSHTLGSCTTIHPSCQKKLTHHHVHIKWPGLHTKWLIYLYQMALIKIIYIYIHIKYSIRYILSTCSNPSSVAGVRIVFFFFVATPKRRFLEELASLGKALREESSDWSVGDVIVSSKSNANNKQIPKHLSKETFLKNRNDKLWTFSSFSLSQSLNKN